MKTIRSWWTVTINFIDLLKNVFYWHLNLRKFFRYIIHKRWLWRRYFPSLLCIIHKCTQLIRFSAKWPCYTQWLWLSPYLQHSLANFPVLLGGGGRCLLILGFPQQVVSQTVFVSFHCNFTFELPSLHLFPHLNACLWVLTVSLWFLFNTFSVFRKYFPISP